MGVKFDAVKDDKIRVEHFWGDDMNEIMEQVDRFLSPTRERYEWQEPDAPLLDKGSRKIPLGISHSTEVIPHLNALNMLSTTTYYHLVLTYTDVYD